MEFGAATYSAGEGGSATVEITLTADPERTVIIPLTKTEQGGISSRRLLRRSRQRDLQHRRDFEDVHLQRRAGRPG